MAEGWSEACVRFLEVQERHRILDMCGACAGPLAQSLHAEIPLGSVPAGLLVANAHRSEGLEDVIQQVLSHHRSPVVFTVSPPHKFPHLLTASPAEGFTKWTAPTGREPTGQFVLEFDRVLCAPKASHPLMDQPWHRHPLHVRMLQCGLAMLVPGGRLVFVTRAQHPVENEAVVAAALCRCGPFVQLTDIQQLTSGPCTEGCKQ